MIDLTPLDVRKKRGDFAKTLRGYDVSEVDSFLELVAERMEVLVKENLKLQERSDRLGEQVDAQEGRENAIQDALVTAQELRRDVETQAQREAELMVREARGQIDEMVKEAGKVLVERRAGIEELERQREQFLKAFRTLLEREMDTVELEFSREPIEDITLDITVGSMGLDPKWDKLVGPSVAEVDSSEEKHPEPASAVSEPKTKETE